MASIGGNYFAEFVFDENNIAESEANEAYDV